MKTLHLGFLTIFIVLIIVSTKPVHAESDLIQILNVQVQPSTIRVNNTFSISTTVLNTSPYSVYLTSGSCVPAFSIEFDSNAKQLYPDIACTMELLIQKVNPQEQVTISNINKPGTIYKATQAGISNANLTIHYFTKNQTSKDYSNIDYTVSKPFQFQIFQSNETKMWNQFSNIHIKPDMNLPLKQFKSGIAVQDVRCDHGLQLVIKTEDGSPACVKPQTAQKLFERGWAQSVSKKSSISIIESSTYLVGQPINATVNYTGYMNGGLYPDVQILNADNGSKVWSNCLYTHTELPSGGGIGTATYDVQCFDKYPVINETGNYIMIASVNNDTTSAKFTIVKPSLPNTILGLGNDTGIVTLKNQTYYFETPNYSHDAYVNPTQISFHNVTFTLFPAGFRGGLPIPCNLQGTYQYYWTDVKFADNTHELLHVQAESPPCATNPIPSQFSSHTNPQAGLIFYDGKMKLLVSTDSQASKKENTMPTSFGTCDTPFSQSNTGVAVFYMPENSTGKICVRYYNLNNTPTGVGARIFEANDLTQNAPDITVSASNNTLQGNENTTIVYSIKTGNKTGLYGFSLTCGGIPLAVGYDANSNLTVSDFPWVGQTFNCFEINYDYHIKGTEGIGVRYIPNP